MRGAISAARARCRPPFSTDLATRVRIAIGGGRAPPAGVGEALRISDLDVQPALDDRGRNRIAPDLHREQGTGANHDRHEFVSADVGRSGGGDCIPVERAATQTRGHDSTLPALITAH